MNSKFFPAILVLFVLSSLNNLYALSAEFTIAGCSDNHYFNRSSHETGGYYISSPPSPPIDTLKVKMCTVTQTDESFGIFYDSGGPEGNYSNSENCSFLIHVHCADSIRLTFKSFYSEIGCDWMGIYQGADASGIMLYTIQGSVFPSVAVAKGSDMYITFHSDGSVNHSGWEAIWEGFIPTGIPPVADFIISDLNPPFATPVTFTDQTTNNPVEWFWDFDDSTSSTLQNPSHIFYNSGEFTIRLIADNCFFKDTVYKTLTVQPPPMIDLLTDTLRYHAYTCFDSVELNMDIKNTGSGDLVYLISSDTTERSEYISIKHYTGTGDSTIHLFNNLYRYSDSIYLELTLNGDFDGSFEYATLIIDGMNLGQIDDMNRPNGTNIVVEYSFGLPDVSSWLSDGRIVIEIINNSSVNSGYGTMLHQVRLTIPKHVWIHTPISEGKISQDETAEVPVIFNWQSLNSGRYESEIFLNSNDSTQPLFKIPCILTIEGTPGFELSDTTLNFGNVRIFTRKELPVWIHNTGCDTLSVFSATNILYEFTADTIQPIILPNDSAEFRVFFSPEDMVEYMDTILIETDIGTYQLSLAGKGEGNPLATVCPDSLIIELNHCNDSTCRDMKVYNEGEGTLQYQITPEELNTIFFDDFEDGDLTGWISDSGAVPEIVTDAALGDYAMKISGNDWYTGVSRTFVPDTITYFSYYCKFVNDSGYIGNMHLGAEVIESNLDIFNIYYRHLGDVWKLVLNNYEIDYSIEELVWYHLEFRNISFREKSFDFFINDNLIKENMPFYNAYCTYISRINLLNSNYTNTCYFDHFKMGQLSHPEWIRVLPEADTVPAGDSSTVHVCFKGSGLNSGRHTATITITTDDPAHPELYIPVFMDLYGSPLMVLSDTLIRFDSTMQWMRETDSLVIYNTGCDTLFIHDLNSSSNSFAVDTSNAIILPGEQYWFGLLFTPDTSGQFDGYLEIKSNAGDTIVHLMGWAEPAPDLVILPDTLKASLSCSHDSVVVPLTFENNGDGDAFFTISNLNPTPTTKMLALTYGVDIDQEYQGTLNAINMYFTDYTLTEVYTTSSLILQEALTGQDVLLIAEQETGSGSVFSGFAGVLQDYVISGGVVIFCGTDNYSCILNSGLFSGSSSYYIGTGTLLNVVNNSHPLTRNLPDQVSATNATWAYNFTDSNIVSLIQYSVNNWDVVCVRQIGKGFTTYIGFDYFLYNNETARIIANAVKWAGKKGLPEWLNIEADSGTVMSKSSLSLNTTFYSHDLPGGDFRYDLIINSNDPRKPSQVVPAMLHIEGKPDMFIPDSAIDFGTVRKYDYTAREFMIFNNGNDTLKITDMITGMEIFRTDSFITEIPPFDSAIARISFLPDSVGTYSDTLYIFSNGGNGMISLSGTCTGIPEINVESESIIVTLQQDDSVTVPLIIQNIGEETLTAGILIAGSGVDTSWFFYDDFEDGNYLGWSPDGSGHTPSIVLSDLDQSMYSLGIKGGYDDLLRGLWKSLDPFSGKYISVCIKPVKTADHAYFAAACDSSSADECMFLLNFMANGEIVLYSDSIHTVTHPYTPDNWYFFEFKDIDFSTKTFDFYINRALICNDFPFRNKELEYITRLILYNPDAEYAEYDNIYVGKTPLADWINISTNEVFLEPGQEDTIYISFRSYGIRTGIHQAYLIFSSNDPHRPEVATSCIMRVIAEPGADFSYHQDGCSGKVYFEDRTLNLPDQWTWDFGDGYGSTEQNPYHIYTTTGSYIVSLRSCNELGCDSAIKTIILEWIGGPEPSVCIPEIIEQHPFVTVTGVIFNTIENYEDNPDSNYEDFSCDIQTVVTKNETYILTVYADSFLTRAWIDYNNDGWFDTVERIMNSPEFYVHERTAAVTIPANAVENIPLRMRVMMGAPYPMEITGNCDSIYLGQVEDYTVIIESSDAPPKAKFGYEIIDLCRSKVQFSDKSFNKPAAWSWMFGDGTGSLGQNPVHQYVSGGTYQVKLFVANDYGADSVTTYIYVPQILAEIFHSGNLTVGDTIQFTDIGSDGTGWQWSFGDGDTAPERSPVHTYTLPGEYLVKVLVTHSAGCTRSDSVLLTIQPPVLPPVAKVSYDVINECAGIVEFLDQSLNNPVTWYWKFGDGTESSGQNPIHQYVTDGTYEVKLKVSNYDGIDSIKTEVYISLMVPEINYDENLTVADTIHFTDTGINGASWLWSFGDGDTVPVKSPIHTYQQPGEYLVKVLVTHPTGCTGSDSALLTIQPLILSPDAMFSYTMINECNGTVEFIDQSLHDPSTWFWRFGDGAISLDQNPVHQFGKGGTCQVSLKVTNDYGTDSYIEEVYIPRIVTKIFHGGNLTEGDTIQFTDIGSGGMDWQWFFGDSETASERSPVHSYALPGEYMVKVLVTNSAGCTLADSLLLTIQPAVLLPVAGLNYVMIDNCSGLVKFLDQSLNGPATWLWRFGDGQEETIQDPVHRYEQSGDYQVTLIASNEGGIDSAGLTLSIHNVTSEIYYDNNANAGDSVLFTDLGSGGTAWVWDFGDGDSAFTTSTFHVYEADNEYVVRMTVFNNYGCELTESVIISVAPPVGVTDHEHFSELQIFPNPTDGKLNIIMFKHTEKDLVLDIFDASGRVILNSSVEGTGQITKEIDLSVYARGIYLLRIWNNDMILTRNIIIQ